MTATAARGDQAEPEEMGSVRLTERDGVVQADLAGEIDISNVGAIEAELHGLANEALGLVLDLRQTTFIDSSVVSLLYGLRERLRRRGQVLRVVVAPSSAPRRVLELTGFEQAGPLDAEPESAERAVRAAAALDAST